MTEIDLPALVILGGSAGAGKTTVGRRLAETVGAALYSCDDQFSAHQRAADRRRHADFLHLAERPAVELWRPEPRAQADRLLAYYRDEFDLIRDDLAPLREHRQVIAEGVGLLPELVAEQLPAARALWLIAGPELRRRRCQERLRQKPNLTAGVNDPDAAFERWMRRDDLVAEHLTSQARRYGLPCLDVDDLDIDQVEAAVRSHLGPRAEG